MKDNRHLYDYQYFHASRNFQTNPGRTKILVEKVMKSNPESVLDVGCGLGSVVNQLTDVSIRAIGVDSAPILEKIWGRNPHFKIADARSLPFKDKEFDVVFSSDFFEHVNEEDIDQVASEMRRVGKRVLTFVSDDVGDSLTNKQREYHVTHKPLSWWKKKLAGLEVYSAHDAA